MSQRPIPVRRLILLLGFMGSGKTTVGRSLSRRLGWNFVDLDAEIERTQGRTINQIFAAEGEPYFRQVERWMLEQVLDRAESVPTVVALGGGTYAQPEVREWIQARGGIAVWLHCPLEELRRRCRGLRHRPLFRDAASFQQLYEQRLPFYQQADFRVEADRSDPEAVVEEILQCGVF